MTIRVGIIGANPDRGWGRSVHVPVLRLLDDFELVAVATTREETARRSATAFGARHAFTDPQALAHHPDVDLVVVSVKVPDHYRLTMLALAAGKHVYCEWPLAATTDQAAEMAALATAKGVRAMVGLQARGAPALLRAKQLVADGHLGRVISVRLACALPGGGGRRSREGLYVIDKANGASTLTIQGGHAIDALRFVAGDIASVAALVATQFDEVEVIETGERLRKDAPDQILVSGLMASGAALSIAISGGIVAGHAIALEIFGETGTLAIGWPGPLNFQMSELTLAGAALPERTLGAIPVAVNGDIPAGFATLQPYPGVDVPHATLANVARLYRGLAGAIRDGGAVHPDFGTGLELHRLLDTIVTASETGRVQAVDLH